VVGRRKIEKKRGGAGPAEEMTQEAWREKKILFLFQTLLQIVNYFEF
jgi:hypothetical protein